uniref:GATA-type domain-containing protein n=1 Tax=Davidia involucrata TaxID=16924 RepID=A0A5B7BBA3_DAVIN
MNPTYLNSSLSPFPAELNEDQHHHQLIFSSNLQASSSSSLSCHIFFDSTQDQSGYYQREMQHQQEVNNLASHGGSHDHLENIESENGLKLSLWKKEDHGNENQSGHNNSVKWMSSKMRLMKNSEIPTIITTQKFEDQEKQPSSPVETDNSTNTSSSNNSNIPVRVCADCNTTKTPLWRSGPRGPKSLCNACGIRQRKARRAMAAAAAANGSTVVATETSSMKAKVVQNKYKRSNINVPQYKKRITKTSSPGRKKLCFEDFLISLSKNLAFHQVFPQDEKEAAILLMALSCGLVHA